MRPFSRAQNIFCAKKRLARRCKTLSYCCNTHLIKKLIRFYIVSKKNDSVSVIKFNA